MKIQKDLYPIYISIAVVSLGIGIVMPLIPLIIRESGASTFMVGLAATLMGLSFAISSFPIGKRIDNAGSKKIIISGLVIYGLSLLALPHFNNIIAFCVIRMIEGIGWAAVWMGAETLINQISVPENRARNMGYYGLAVAIGMAGGPIMGMYLSHTSIFLPFYFCFGLSLLTVILVGIFLKSKSFKDKSAEELGFTKIAKILKVPIAAAFVYGYIESSMIALLPIYLISISISNINLGMVISTFLIGGVLFQVPSGIIADRIGKYKSLIIFAIILSIGCLFAPIYNNLYYLMVIGFIIGAFGGALYPVGLSILPGKITYAKLGSANATFTFVYGVGSIMGPILSALFMDYINIHSLFVVIVPISIIFIYIIFKSK